jgi:cell division protein FtsB
MKKFTFKGLSNIFEFLTPVRALALVGVIVFFWLFILGDQGVYQLRNLMEMNQKLVDEKTELNDEIDQLKREKAMLSEPENVEMVIRAELGYIRPGEVVFEEKTQ